LYQRCHKHEISYAFPVETGAEDKRQLHAWLSSNALDAWSGFAHLHGTNVTALLEALGRQLGALDDKPFSGLPALLRTAVVESREIAAQRTSRHRR
jgi:hypothetical protein